MASIDDVFSGETLKAADLQGREHVVVISRVERKTFDDGNKLSISFEGRKKCLIANKTNSARIAMIAGTKDYEVWPGVAIALVSEMVDFKGHPTLAIRVRSPSGPGPASAAAPQPRPAPPVSVAGGYAPPRSAPPRRDELDDELIDF